jgi:hypothetical protein
MKKFTYVEDYIQVINGDMDPTTGRAYGLFNTTPPIINLARYDVNIIANMSSSIDNNTSLTDKQGEIAAKIILKYKKQLLNLGIDVSPVENPQFKTPLRVVDRRKLLYIEDNQIVAKFPYEPKMIDMVRELSKMSDGSWSFDRDQKLWRLAITEPNVVAIVNFAKINGFDISTEFLELEELVNEAERIPYSIKLEMDDEKLFISNAPDSLNQYIEKNCGGYSYDNLISLIDNSDVLGYTIDDSIKEAFQIEYKDSSIYELLTLSEKKYKPDSDESVYDEIYSYATLTNRFPIFVYEPNTNGTIYNSFVKKYFKDEDVLVCQHKDTINFTDFTKKVVYFNKYNYMWDKKIPLLISGVGIMHGGEKTMLLQRSEKRIFFASEVYRQGTKQ